MKNKFIVIEGPDGSGKSTLARLLQEALSKKNIYSTLFREPGATELGEQVRQILADRSLHISPRAETLLFCAARAELADRIKEALRAGWVLLDRYEGSTLVYQGIVRELGTKEVLRISRWASEDLQPDETLVLLLDTRVSQERRSSRAEDRMEATTEVDAVLQGYRWLATQPGHVPISADGSPEEALRLALDALKVE